ncbi:MAG TPA: serine/threonine-protein kinase, partial [Steroidobacteraceae bacterium]|nr:serine/threonine-protein kinase [Steroidobacteraceae bacterium]
LDGGLIDKSQPYLVLEFIEGEPIDEYCDRKKLDVVARVTLFCSVLAAIGHAHSHLIVHRSLKPSNILVTDDGAVKVLDFGIAELLSEDAAAAATHTYSLALAPQFAAPEQLSGQPISAAVDVYSAALVLYRLLTGISPRRVDGSSAELMRSAIHESPARASSVAPDPLRRALAGDLDAILAHALEQDPVRRYRSVDLFAEDLRRYLAHEPVLAREPGTADRMRKLVLRHRVALPVAAAVGLCLLANSLYCLLQWQTMRLQRDVALDQARSLESQCPTRIP